MAYKGYDNFTDRCVDFHPELNHIHDFTDYRVDGQKCALKTGTMNKLMLFISWMSTRMKDTTVEQYVEHILALTYEDFNVFRTADMNRMSSEPISPPPGPTTPMTTFSGHTKGSTVSASQVAVNNFKKGTKRDASAFPIFKNDLYYDTFHRDLSWQPSRHKDYMMLLTQILILTIVINMTSKASLKNNLFVYSVFVTSLQTEKGRELVKEFEGDARTIISKLHHYHTESNVGQHEIVTLTTYITNLSHTDSWKSTTDQFLSHFKEKLHLLDSLVP